MIAPTRLGPAGGRLLRTRLRLLQLRLWLEQLVGDAVRGLCLGLAIAVGGAVALVVQSGVVRYDGLLLAALAGLGLGLSWALVRPPTLLRTARVVDARFGLADRA